MAYIYTIKNKVNNDQYIGCTRNNISDRFKKHISNAKNVNNNIYLYQKMREFEIENFYCEQLAEIDIDEMFEAEECFIKECIDSNIILYNTILSNAKYTAKKIELETIEKVKSMIRNTDFSFEKIAIENNMSLFSVSDINRGKTHKEEVDYPIRKTINTKKHKDLSDDDIMTICRLLRNTKMSMDIIAGLYGYKSNVMIKRINSGKTHKLFDNEYYPIRQRIKTTKALVLKVEKYLSKNSKSIEEYTIKYSDIAKENNVSVDVIKNINYGRLTYSSKNIKFPIATVGTGANLIIR